MVRYPMERLQSFYRTNRTVRIICLTVLLRWSVCVQMRYRFRTICFFCREEDLFAYLSKLNRFLKRSTRPPVSTSFCLPVKNGWHFCTDFNLDVLLGGHGFHYVAAVTSDGGLFKSRVQSLFSCSFTSFCCFYRFRRIAIKIQQPIRLEADSSPVIF